MPCSHYKLVVGTSLELQLILYTAWPDPAHTWKLTHLDVRLQDLRELEFKARLDRRCVA